MRKLIAWTMLGAVGCAVPPPPPEVPSTVEYEFRHLSTGQPLRFEAKDGTRMVEEKFPIREHSIYDSRGWYLGKDIEYGTRPVERKFHEWNVYQGDEVIDPLSALYIARDRAFMAAYEEERDRVKRDHALAMESYETEVKSTTSSKNLGLALGVVGLVGMVGTGLVFLATRSDENTDGQPLPATLSGVASLGFMGLSIGGFYVRSKAGREQAAAMSKAGQLASSRMNDRAFSRFGNEEHVRNALGSKPPEKAPPREDVGEAPAPPEEPTSIPVPAININKSLKPLVDGAIPNNKKLGPALIATWQPDASGSIPPRAHDDFEKEFLRSQLYFVDLGGNIPLHQGHIAVYADMASLEAVEGKGKKVKAISAIEVLMLALAAGRGIYVHYEGDVSFFAVIHPDQVAKVIGKASAPAK